MKPGSRTLAQFIKFSIVGLSNMVIAYAIYVALVYLGIHYIAASIVSFMVSVLNSFFWNQKYVFKFESGGWRDTARALLKTYASYSLSGFVVGPALLYVFVDLLNISKYIAPLLGLVVTVPMNYILNRFWAFKPGGRAGKL